MGNHIDRIIQQLETKSRTSGGLDSNMAAHIEAAGFREFVESLKNPAFLTTEAGIRVFMDCSRIDTRTGPLDDMGDGSPNIVEAVEIEKASRLIRIADEAIGNGKVNDFAEFITADYGHYIAAPYRVADRLEGLKVLQAYAANRDVFAKFEALELSIHGSFDWLECKRADLLPENQDDLMDIMKALPEVNGRDDNSPRRQREGYWECGDGEVIRDLLNSKHIEAILKDSEGFIEIMGCVKGFRDNFKDMLDNTSPKNMQLALDNSDKFQQMAKDTQCGHQLITSKHLGYLIENSGKATQALRHNSMDQILSNLSSCAIGEEKDDVMKTMGKGRFVVAV